MGLRRIDTIKSFRELFHRQKRGEDDSAAFWSQKGRKAENDVGDTSITVSSSYKSSMLQQRSDVFQQGSNVSNRSSERENSHFPTLIQTPGVSEQCQRRHLADSAKIQTDSSVSSGITSYKFRERKRDKLRRLFSYYFPRAPRTCSPPPDSQTLASSAVSSEKIKDLKDLDSGCLSGSTVSEHGRQTLDPFKSGSFRRSGQTATHGTTTEPAIFLADFFEESPPEENPQEPSLDINMDDTLDYEPRFDHSFRLEPPSKLLPKQQHGKWERSQMLRHTASKYDLASLKSKRSQYESSMTTSSSVSPSTPSDQSVNSPFMSPATPLLSVPQQVTKSVSQFFKSTGSLFTVNTSAHSPTKSIPSVDEGSNYGRESGTFPTTKLEPKWNEAAELEASFQF